MTSATAEQAAPKRRGRPAGSGEGRDTPITWRTTLARREKAQRMATAADMSLSAWLDKRIDSARE